VTDQGTSHRRPRRSSQPPEAARLDVRVGRNRRVAARAIRRQLVASNVALLAAGTAFWAVLSIFPAMIAMVTIYGIVASPDQVTSQVAKLGGSLSQPTREVIQSWLAGLTNSSHRGLGIGLIVGLAAVLWAASSGVQTLIKAITAAYAQPEDRGFVKLRGLALLMSVGVIVIAIAMLTAIGLAPVLRHLVHNTALRLALDIGEWIVLAVILGAAISALYRFAPAHKPATWRWASPGAMLSTVLVVGASIGFSFYVRFFAHYNRTYGALGGVVILMLWLYYSAYAVLVGAVVNAEAAPKLDLVEQQPAG
jgi:membrane protein